MIDTVLHHVQHLFLNLFQFILHLNYDLLHFSMIGLAEIENAKFKFCVSR